MRIDQIELYPTPIYRCVTELYNRILYTPNDSRIPKHIPLLVDNIWEYFRPSHMPSRRRSAFGSPTVDMAKKFGPHNGIVCRVAISVPYVIAQIPGCPDASIHPDVRAISSILDEADLGQGLDELSTVLLCKKRTGRLLAGVPDILHALMKVVTLWDQCRRIELSRAATYDFVGEFFFEAPRGYFLERFEG